MSGDFLGQTGFVWFFGEVESIDDPMEIDRVRVRIHGQHSLDKSATPTTSLPWAQVVLPATANDAQTHDLWIGMVVYGFFVDGEARQIPMVMGVLPGIIPAGKNYRNSIDKTISGYSQNKARLKSKNIPLVATGIQEPDDPYNPTYPLNKVIESAAGHVIEMDNTPGNERVHVFHKSGSFFEFHPDGSVVCKSLGDAYDISNKSRFEFTKDNKTVTIDGDENITITGDHSNRTKGKVLINSGTHVEILSAGGIDLLAAGKIRMKGSSVAIEGAGAVDIKAGAALGLDGSKVNLGIAKSSGLGSYTNDISIITPSTQQINQDKFFMEFDDDSDAATAALEQAISEGRISKEDAAKYSAKPEILEEDKAPASAIPPEIVSCIALKGKQVTDSLKLSKYFTLGQLTKFTAVSNYPIKAQRGLTQEQIACNLHLLANNCLDKIRERYPNMYIQSGFRHGEGKSQHELGQACDLRFRGVSPAEYIGIAKWIRDNIPFDQLLLETLSSGSGIPWIHVSFSSARQRGQVLTLHNHRTVSQGLSRVA